MILLIDFGINPYQIAESILGILLESNSLVLPCD